MSQGIEELMRASRASSAVAGDQAARLRALIEAAEGVVELPAERVHAEPRAGGGVASREVEPLEMEPSPSRLGRVSSSDCPEQPSQQRGAVLVTVASGKGGVGKTNIAVNLAIATARLGCRTVLMDADLGTANADVLCGLMPTARLNHVITALPVHDGGKRTLAQIAVDAPGGFRLIPGAAGVGRMANLAGPQRRQLVDSIGQLELECDLIIVDAGAGVSSMVTSFIEASDRTLIVTTPEPTAITDAYSLVKCVVGDRFGHGMTSGAEANGGHMAGGTGGGGIGFVLNQVVDEAEARAVHGRINAVCDRFLGVRVPMRGWVAQDVRVSQAVRSKRPLMLASPRSPAACNISAIACSLIQDLALETGGRGGKREPGRLSRAIWRLVGGRT